MRYAITLCWFLQFGISLPGNAQLYVPESATISIHANAGNVFYVSGDFQNLGKVSIGEGSSLVFTGNTLSNGAAAEYEGKGKLVMSTPVSGNQSIDGGGRGFANLEINNPGDVRVLNTVLKVDSVLSFVSGKLLTGDKNVIIGVEGEFSGYGAGRYVDVSGGGHVIKELTGNVQFTFPVGDETSLNQFSPVTLNISGTSYSPGSTVSVRVNNSVHPQKTGRHTDFINRNWQVDFTNIADGLADYSGTYVVSDVNGTGSNVRGSTWEGSEWFYVNSGSGASTITGRITGDGDITGQSYALKVKAKVYLQGSYNGTATMNKTLRTLNVIPAVQPYGSLPLSNNQALNYAGLETRASLPAEMVDWVVLELRNTATGASVSRTAAILLSNGELVDGYYDGPAEFLNVAEGNYYLVVKHRNHLSVMTPVLQSFPNTSRYDFTTSSGQSYGAAATLSGGRYGMYAGNTNGNSNVRYQGPANDVGPVALSLNGNLATVLSNVYRAEDINMNGNVRYQGPNNDFIFLFNNVLQGNAFRIISQGF